jgi:hypothetical protein
MGPRPTEGDDNSDAEEDIPILDSRFFTRT